MAMARLRCFGKWIPISASALFIVPCLLALRFVATPRDATPLMLAAGGGGVVIGKLLCNAMRSFYRFPVYSRWDFFKAVPFRHWLNINFSHFSLCLYSFAFALWIPLVVAVADRYPRAKGFVLVYAAAILGLCGAETTLVEAKEIGTSFPTFAATLRALGATL